MTMPEYQAARRRRGPDRGRDRDLEGQGRRRRRDQRHRRRDRDREVAGRAAVAVRRHGDRAAGARGRDGRRSARRSSRSATRTKRRRPRRPRPLPPSRRWRSTSPTRAPAVAARARAWSAATRPTAARSAAPARPRPRASPSVPRPPTCRSQGSFQPGPSPMVEGADEPRRPGRSPARTSAAPTDVRVLAKPPVRKLAKDLGVDLTTLTPTGAGGTVTRADVESAAAAAVGRRRLRPASRPALQRRSAHRGARAPRADQGRPQDDGRRDGAVGVHRAARHRVDHRRRHRDDGVRRAAQEAARVPATSRSRRCWC